MKRTLLAVSLALCLSVTYAETVIVDPSTVADGTDISTAFPNVVLATAVGSIVINDLDVTQPLTLTSDLTTPVFAVGGVFSHSSGSTWSAGQCCGGDEVLRADFDRPTFAVSVLFVPDDTDTGVLQIYDQQDRLLAEELVRDNQPFTISLETPRGPIAYALATFGDTGKLATLSYDIPPNPKH